MTPPTFVLRSFLRSFSGRLARTFRFSSHDVESSSISGVCRSSAAPPYPPPLFFTPPLPTLYFPASTTSTQIFCCSLPLHPPFPTPFPPVTALWPLRRGGWTLIGQNMFLKIPPLDFEMDLGIIAHIHFCPITGSCFADFLFH